MSQPPKDPDLNEFIKLIRKSPQLAPEFERIAAYFQGKGFGTATIVEEVDLALEMLKKRPQLAIDIGGNIGDYTAELRAADAKLEIHTFEPSAVNIAKLEKRFADDPKVKIVPFAVSDTSGPATLFSNEPGSGLGSLTRRKLEHYNIAFDVQETVETIRLEDYWINELNTRPIDFVKIDVEGHELAALRSFGAAIAVTSVIQFEFGGTDIDTRTFFRDFWFFFEENRFDIFRISPQGPMKIERYAESSECFLISNYLAVNRRAT